MTSVRNGVGIMQAQMWAAVSGAWSQHAAFLDERGAEIDRRMLDLTAPNPDDAVLELACGPGGPGLAAARRVPHGTVVLSDLVPEMTAIAAARAEQLGLTNVTARPLDLQAIAEPDASFDVILCREGLMFAPDPALACREVHRVLKPAGRAAFAVWGPRERNPWLGIVLDAVSAQLGRPVPPPGPGPFALSDAATVDRLFTQAGFTKVTVDEVGVPLRADSLDAWWSRTVALAGPLALILRELPPPAVEALRLKAQDAARPYLTASGLEFPGVSFLVYAHRV